MSYTYSATPQTQEDKDKQATVDKTNKINSANPINWLFPSSPDLSATKSVLDRSFGLEDSLAAERDAYTGNFNKGMDDRLAGRQLMNITNLERAAAGQTPSAAEIQLQQMAGQNAARQFGLATALQGRNPGAALRSGRLGSLATQDQANVEAAMLRAHEQEAARNALVAALTQARGQGIDLLHNDTDWRKALLSGEGNALESAARAAGAYTDASEKAAASENQQKSDKLKVLSLLAA